MKTDKNFVDPVAYLRMNRYQFPSREGSLFVAQGGGGWRILVLSR